MLWKILLGIWGFGFSCIVISVINSNTCRRKPDVAASLVGFGLLWPLSIFLVPLFFYRFIRKIVGFVADDNLKLELKWVKTKNKELEEILYETEDEYRRLSVNVEDLFQNYPKISNSWKQYLRKIMYKRNLTDRIVNGA